MTKKLDPRMIVIGSFLLLALAIGAVGWFAVIAPERSKVGELSGEIASAQTELTVAQGSKSAVPGQTVFHASDLFRLAKAMPSISDMPGILIGLRNLGAKSSVELTSVRPSPLVPLPLGYSALPLAVTVTGTYPALSTFMGLLSKDVRLGQGARLEVGGRLFNADSIQLQTVAKGNSLTATLALDAFVYTGVILPSPAANGQATGTIGSTATATTPAATPSSGSRG